MDILPDIKKLAATLTAELTALRREFHRHPELSHHEERTARGVAEYLDKLGLAVQTGVAGHGVVGRLQGSRPGRVVAWRADTIRTDDLDFVHKPNHLDIVVERIQDTLAGKEVVEF